jgi:hypothetical protein
MPVQLLQPAHHNAVCTDSMICPSSSGLLGKRAQSRPSSQNGAGEAVCTSGVIKIVLEVPSGKSIRLNVITALTRELTANFVSVAAMTALDLDSYRRAHERAVVLAATTGSSVMSGFLMSHPDAARRAVCAA